MIDILSKKYQFSYLMILRLSDYYFENGMWSPVFIANYMSYTLA